MKIRLVVYFVIVGLLIGLSSSSGCSSKNFEEPTEYESYPPPLQIIQQFLEGHPEFGSFENVEDMPDWAFGKSRKVTTTTGMFRFYLKEGEVDGIDKLLPGGATEKIYTWDFTPFVSGRD